MDDIIDIIDFLTIYRIFVFFPTGDALASGSGVLGGSIQIESGVSEETSGNIVMRTANGGANANSASGDIELFTGQSANGDTGSISVSTSDAAGGSAGQLSVTVGASDTNAGADMILSSGSSSAGAGAEGGDILMNAGSGTTSGGDISVEAGSGSVTGGSLSLLAGKIYVESYFGLLVIG